MPSDQRRCVDCAHFAPFVARGRQLAHCRFNAPVVHPVDGTTVWPLVQPSFGCGQWVQSSAARQRADARRRAYERGCKSGCACTRCAVELPRQVAV